MPKKRKLKNPLCTLSRTEHGFVINPPAHKGLVISGGGAKGLAYAGMFQAMHDRGLLKQLTHVSGASAGAMTASFLAIGMHPEDILKISTRLDITKLLDSKGMMSRAEGTRVRNIFELFYIFQIKQHLNGIPKPQTPEEILQYSLLQNKIKLYEHALSIKNIKIETIDDILQLTNSSKSLRDLDSAFTQLPKSITDQQGDVIENPRITFKDLSRLRALLPEDQKHLIKHLSVVTTNQSRKIIETYNEDNDADTSIAEVVQQSGAHPVLFKPAKNAKGEHIADGGIINNMPTRALENSGLKPEEILCTKAESGSSFAERLNRVKHHGLEAVSDFNSFMDSIIREILGGRVFEGRAKVLNREKIFFHMGNMLYLNTGKITTITTSPTQQQRDQAIETAYQQTLEFIDGQTKTFDSALIAMLYLGIENLDQTLINKDTDNELFMAAVLAKKIFLLQTEAVKDLTRNHDESAIEYITQIEEVLKTESELSEAQQDHAMSLCLKQINYFSEGKLEHYILNKIKEEQGPKVNWFIHLLELLWKPIEWILSLCTNTNVQTIERIPVDPPVSTPLRILSFLSYKEPRQSDGVLDELIDSDDESHVIGQPD
ncbi:patatin-like phospholipase family protein [Legionella quateirensis]|uniref:VipD n=1 Tax=Legionella quateirensis TaxID=45072 RepID=A0A378KR91_9GAMM|nr:patatin-like phospholipase family protein [Legionella quateirensis]KTD51338.1 VipD [Legionella quateirensis]STY17414.1 VipD [Legionella quateirensis]